MRTNITYYLLPITCYLLPVTLATPSVAQSTLLSCVVPENNEYVLLIVTETEDKRAKVLQAIPNDIEVSFCDYLGKSVTHIGSFINREDAEEWGQYFQENLDLTAVIVESSQTLPLEVVSEPPPIITQGLPNTSETISVALPQTNNLPSYNPQALGTGYAILIDYVNQPEIANQLQQLLSKEIGLVSYLARPYLIAIHTTSESEANAMLKNLSDRGFWTIMVDSSKVTLLTPTVK